MATGVPSSYVGVSSTRASRRVSTFCAVKPPDRPLLPYTCPGGQCANHRQHRGKHSAQRAAAAAAAYQDVVEEEERAGLGALAAALLHVALEQQVAARLVQALAVA